MWKKFLTIVEVGDANQLPFTISCSEGGSVEFSTFTVTNSSTSESFDKGENVTMKFSPEKGYKLKSVVVNEKDVSADISDNSYTVVVEMKTDVVVTFEKLPIYLTIQQADKGKIRQQVNEGSIYSFVVEATEGWRVNTVAFNGVDVTNELDAENKYTTPTITENSTLNVSFELETPSAVHELSERHVSIRGYNGNIVVEGANQGDEIKVYAIDGAMIASMISNGSNVQINVEENQVYVVKVAQRTFKLSL